MGFGPVGWYFTHYSRKQDANLPLKVLVVEVHDHLLARGYLRQEFVLRDVAILLRKESSGPGARCASGDKKDYHTLHRTDEHHLSTGFVDMGGNEETSIGLGDERCVAIKRPHSPIIPTRSPFTGATPPALSSLSKTRTHCSINF